MVAVTIYLDSSAIVRVVARERGWPKLESYLREHPQRAASRLATVEVARAVARLPGPSEEIADRMRSMFERIALLEFDARVAATALTLRPATLRTLDAIHLASALQLGGDLTALVTYDQRMAEAGRGLMVSVAAP